MLVSHDPAEIAAALERLIDDPELRLALGEGARRHALEQHDFDQVDRGPPHGDPRGSGGRPRAP